MDLTFLTQFIDNNKLGGWVRAIVAAGFVAAIAKWPILGTVVDPAIQTQVAAALAAVAVGLWSQLTKTDSAKLASVEALPQVTGITVSKNATDGIADAAADPSRPKVTT